MGPSIACEAAAAMQLTGDITDCTWAPLSFAEACLRLCSRNGCRPCSGSGRCCQQFLRWREVLVSGTGRSSSSGLFWLQRGHALVRKGVVGGSMLTMLSWVLLLQITLCLQLYDNQARHVSQMSVWVASLKFNSMYFTDSSKPPVDKSSVMVCVYIYCISCSAEKATLREMHACLLQDNITVSHAHAQI